MQKQNKIDMQLRQWAMLKHIPQHPSLITTRELYNYLQSDGFSVGIRTIERDLISLSGVFPLLSDERSKPFGWSWSKDAPAFSLPTMSPIQALTFELAHEHLAHILPATLLSSLKPYFKCAEGVLTSGNSVKKLASWRKKVAIVPANQPLIPAGYTLDIIEAVHSALLNEQQLEITYVSREQAETKTYPIHPLGLVQRGAVTYLIATLYNYPDIRLLAIHRIKEAKLLDQPIISPTNFNLAQYVSQGAFGFDESGLIDLVVRFTQGAAEHLLETPLSLNQRITSDQFGWVRLNATVPNTAQLRWWLMGFGEGVEVLEPISLRQEFVEMAQALNDVYKATK